MQLIESDSRTLALREVYSRLLAYTRRAGLLSAQQLAAHDNMRRHWLNRLNLLVGQWATLPSDYDAPDSVRDDLRVARIALNYPGIPGRLCSKATCTNIHYRRHGWCRPCQIVSENKRKSA